MTEAKRQVEATELLTEATGRGMAETLGEEATPQQLTEALSGLPTDWHRGKAMRGFRQFRAEQDWVPVIPEE